MPPHDSQEFPSWPYAASLMVANNDGRSPSMIDKGLGMIDKRPGMIMPTPLLTNQPPDPH